MDNLMDMEKSSEDFADDFSEYMMKSFLAQQIGTKYNDRLKAWYESWAKDLEDGALSEGEIERMRSEYSQLVDEAIAERDRIAAITGYDTTSSTQEASSKAFASMSEDTGEELNGRFTALQESNESIKNEVSVISMSVSEIVGLQSEQKGLLNGCLDMMARQLLAQEAIRENTEAIIKPIQDIKKDISQIKSNTSRL
jgi:DNA repair ATPase RecN